MIAAIAGDLLMRPWTRLGVGTIAPSCCCGRPNARCLGSDGGNAEYLRVEKLVDWLLLLPRDAAGEELALRLRSLPAKTWEYGVTEYPAGLREGSAS